MDEMIPVVHSGQNKVLPFSNTKNCCWRVFGFAAVLVTSVEQGHEQTWTSRGMFLAVPVSLTDFF